MLLLKLRLLCPVQTGSLSSGFPSFWLLVNLVNWSFSFLLGKRFDRTLLYLVVRRECFEIIVLSDRKSLSSLPVGAWRACSLLNRQFARVGMGMSDKRASHVFDSPGNFMFPSLGRILNGNFSCHYSIPKEDSWLDYVLRHYKSELMAEIGW